MLSVFDDRKGRTGSSASLEILITETFSPPYRSYSAALRSFPYLSAGTTVLLSVFHDRRDRRTYLGFSRFVFLIITSCSLSSYSSYIHVADVFFLVSVGGSYFTAEDETLTTRRFLASRIVSSHPTCRRVRVVEISAAEASNDYRLALFRVERNPAAMFSSTLFAVRTSLLSSSLYQQQLKHNTPPHSKSGSR